MNAFLPHGLQQLALTSQTAGSTVLSLTAIKAKRQDIMRCNCQAAQGHVMSDAPLQATALKIASMLAAR